MASAAGRSSCPKDSGDKARRGETQARAVVVHSIDHARAALAAAQAAEVSVTLMSGRDAGAYLGPRWFRDLVELAACEYPGVRVEAVLDCGDRAGLVMAALRAGLKLLGFSGSRATAARLGQIAAAQDARIIRRRPPGLDLLDHPAPAEACRKWLEDDRHR